MATIEVGHCRDDSDCSERQYCYDVSNTCVDYMQCRIYNRQENPDGKSRRPSQCGPCLPGYTTEELGTGEMAVLCRKVNGQQNEAEASSLNINMIMYTTISVFSCVMLLALIVTVTLKWRASRKRGNKSICVVPTAPPLENRPFIDSGVASSPVPFNNNKNLKDRNNLVRAAAYTPPDWVRTNPNYENDLNNENVEAMEQLHSVAEFPADEQSNSWTSEQRALQVPSGSVVGFEIEQVDNSSNAVLIEMNSPSSSNANEDNANNNNNNNTSTGSASQSSNTQNNKERVRASNILISQKISMNVNLLNGDY